MKRPLALAVALVTLVVITASCGDPAPTSGEAAHSDEQIVSFLHEHKRVVDRALAGYVPDSDSAAPGEDPVVAWRQLRDELFAAREQLARLPDAESDELQAAVELCDRYGGEVEELYRIAGDGDVFPEADTPEGEQRLRATMEHWEKAQKAQAECEEALAQLGPTGAAPKYAQTDQEIILYLLLTKEEQDQALTAFTAVGEQAASLGPNAGEAAGGELRAHFDEVRAAFNALTMASIWSTREPEDPVVRQAQSIEGSYVSALVGLAERVDRLLKGVTDDEPLTETDWRRRLGKFTAELEGVSVAKTDYERALERLRWSPEGRDYSRRDLEIVLRVREERCTVDWSLEAYKRDLREDDVDYLTARGGLVTTAEWLRDLPDADDPKVGEVVEAFERYAGEVCLLFFVKPELEDPWGYTEADAKRDGSIEDLPAHHEKAVKLQAELDRALERYWKVQ